jgi:hypothetical protein
MESENPRTTFYLANTLKDQQYFAQAIPPCSTTHMLNRFHVRLTALLSVRCWCCSPNLTGTFILHTVSWILSHTVSSTPLQHGPPLFVFSYFLYSSAEAENLSARFGPAVGPYNVQRLAGTALHVVVLAFSGISISISAG